MSNPSRPSCSIFLAWEDILPHLHKEITEAAPEIKGKQTIALLRARPNGFWIEFYEDEAALTKRRLQATLDGPEIMAGLLDLE